MIRLGLCCIFRDQPIKFGSTTATSLARLDRSEALAKLGRLARANADALHEALQFCARNGIGSFRICSQILPQRTHPTQGYVLDQLPEADAIVRRFRDCGDLARKANIRTSFHPDQFVVLNSPRGDVVDASVREIEYQAEVAEWVGADVINVHGGGAYGDPGRALETFARNLPRLSDRARKRLTVENDDKIFTPTHLLPLCRAEGIPLVYDVHHHRCRRDELSVESATEQALTTWDREPLFHVSSPLEGWDGPKPERHHDFVHIADFPTCWLDRDLTVEVEAKAKELAIFELRKDLERLGAARQVG